MKFFLFILIILNNLTYSVKAESIIFYLQSAFNNNPKLNAERENVKAIKENINISKSEFLPSVSVSGNLDSVKNTNRTNQEGIAIADSSKDTETKSISVDQKIFQGFQGYNSFKKSQLEVEQANFRFKNTEQEILLNAISAYYDLMFKSKNKEFNLANIDLFERQVETDNSRLQKGEITFTDLAQSESSLAGANANFISAETELLTARTYFERIIRIKPPKSILDNLQLNINLPKNLNEALSITEKNNPKLIIAKIDAQISEKEVNIERSKLSPSASINYTRSENKDFSSTIDDIDQENIKATIKWPIIKGGKNYSILRKSKFKKEQTNLILADTKNEVLTDTSIAWSLFQSAQSVLKSTKAQLKAAEIANEGITLEYDSGNTRTTLEVIQSRSLLLGARIDNARAERDFMISKFKLLESVGNLTFENIKNL
jgi:outer membrane protein